MGHRDDPVLCQIGRFADDGMPRQISRRRRDHAANFADADRDEVRIGEMRDAERDVDALVDQIHRPVEQDEPRRHRLIFVHEGFEDRPQNIFAGDDGRGQGQRAARRRAFAAGDEIGLLEFDEDAAARRDIALAGLAQLERPRGAVKQFGPDMVLEEGDRAAHGGR